MRIDNSVCDRVIFYYNCVSFLMTPTGARPTALHKAFFSLVLPCKRALFRMPAMMPLNPLL